MNPLQRASRNRKIIYLGVILALFTVSMVWRGMIPVPLGASAASAASPFRWAATHTIQSQAKRLEVWESDPEEGDPEITGSAARLALTGSRGFVVTGLWLSAIDKQKRNDFHEFEQRVQMVTKLQPNFITPWIFQSWNIAYNVSVEMHGSGDMYYYIARGISLLAEGERRNRRSPDMRYQIAFYYQNKFGVSDQVDVLRCLFDLSCMPPSERDPDNLTVPETGEVNREKFRRFCARHPHFVRRLRGEEAPPRDKQAREKLRASTPEDIVRFLRTHYKDLPNRYRKNEKNQWTDDLADKKDQFPALPDQFHEGPNEAHPGVATPDDFAPQVGYFSGFKAARAWFTYSLLLLPPPLKDGPWGRPDTEGDPLPGPTAPPGIAGHDPSKHRVPRLPTMIIFRQGAPRAQTYAAELEQKEGWFDGDGWRIDDPAAGPDNWWFPDNPNPALRSRPQDVVVGSGRAWSLIEWQRAAELWRLHGTAYALSLSAQQLENLQRLAGDPNTLPADATPEQIADPNLQRRYMAMHAQWYYTTNRHTTNFAYFLASAEAEEKPLTVRARKTLWTAEQARKAGNKPRALELYKEGLTLWKQVLSANPQFHRPSRTSDKTEEETFEYELAYLRLLVQEDTRVRERADQIARALALTLRVDSKWLEANREEIKWLVVDTVAGADFSSPFVNSPSNLAPDGTPWIRDDLKESVRLRLGISRRPQPQPQGPPPGAPPAPGPTGPQPVRPGG